MKKIIVSLLLVLLTVFMFVACSSSPKEACVGKVHLDGINEIVRETGKQDRLRYTKGLEGDYYFDNNFTIGEQGLDFILYKDAACTDPSEYVFSFIFVGIKEEGTECALTFKHKDCKGPNWASESTIISEASLTQDNGAYYLNFSDSFKKEFLTKDPNFFGTITLEFGKDTSFKVATDD